MIANAEILGILAAHLVLTAAPGVAAVLLAVRLGARGVPLLVGVALAASGLAAYGAFWAYFASPDLGTVYAFLVLFGSVEVAAWSWYRGLDRDALRPLLTPLALWALGMLFVVFLGFLHGGAEQSIGTSATRFSGPLPPDNDIPRFFAEWFADNGSAGTPPIYPGEWLMSDRPPLQIGYVLSQEAFFPTPENLHYQLLCVAIQGLWIPALWVLLCAAGLRPGTRGLAMLAALVSDIAILHGFFVWPKLIAAAFVLAAFALVLSPDWARWRRDPRVAALIGSLLGLAMLGHGSSVFGIVPLLAIAAWRGGIPSWRWLGVAALTGAALLGSWSAYQRFDDPPGNRLVKWHLGGALEVDDRGTLEAIVDGYREAGFDGTLDNKWNNVEEITGLSRGETELGGAVDALEAGELEQAAGWLRGFRFFALFAVLGVFLIAPLAMLAGRRRPGRDEADWRFALHCLAFVAIGCAFWVLAQFGQMGHSSTMIHAGTLAIPLLAICGCVAGLRAAFPRLALAVVALNAVFVLALYVPSLTPPPDTSYSPLAALLAAAGLIGFGAVAYSSSAMRGAPRANTRAPATQTPTKSAIEGSSSS